MQRTSAGGSARGFCSMPCIAPSASASRAWSSSRRRPRPTIGRRSSASTLCPRRERRTGQPASSRRSTAAGRISDAGATLLSRPAVIRQLLALTAGLALPLAWFAVHAGGWAASPPEQAFAAGAGILGAAFLLSWASEAAQLDIPQALALLFLALVAVLPEYAVDVYFAWRAGTDPAYTAFATANMTGGNRLLLGVGWAVPVLAVWLRTGRREIVLPRDQAVEVNYLALATLYSFVIPVKGTLSIVDTAVLLAIFLGYARAASRAHHTEPDLEGPASALAALPPGRGHGALRGRRRHDLYGRRALCRRAHRHRAPLRDRGVPARAVARAARLGGAGVRGRRALRAQGRGGRRHRDHGVVEGEPVDAPRGRAARRVCALAREPPPDDPRCPPAGGDLPHVGPVGLRPVRDRELPLRRGRGAGAPRPLRSAARLHVARGALALCRGLPRARRGHADRQPRHAPGRAPPAAGDGGGALDEHLGGAQARDRGVVVAADAAEDLVGVLAEAGRGRAHPAVVLGHAPGHAEVGADADLGMLEGDEEAARGEVRILGEVAVRRRGERGDAGRLEERRRLLGRALGRPCRDDRLERVFVLLAGDERRKARVPGQLGAAEQRREARPGGVVLDGERDPTIVARGAEDAAGRHVRIAVPVARGLPSAHRPLEDRLGQHGDRGLPLREIDELPLPGARPMQQRGEHGDRPVQPTRRVAVRHADVHRRMAAVAGDRGHARERHLGRAVGDLVRVGAVCAVARERDHDDVGTQPTELLVAEA